MISQYAGSKSENSEKQKRNYASLNGTRMIVTPQGAEIVAIS
jgi:hypothetical protein